MHCFVFHRKKKNKGREVMNALRLFLVQASYLLCLKRYLLNTTPASRPTIMIAVHLDKLHSGNPFSKIWTQLEAEGDILHLLSVPPVTITGICMHSYTGIGWPHPIIPCTPDTSWHENTHTKVKCKTHVTHCHESKFLFCSHDVKHVTWWKPEHKSRGKHMGGVGGKVRQMENV